MSREPALHAIPLGDVYALLEPGPVVLVTTAQNGRDNVMTQSWHMMAEFTPPYVASIVSSGDYSFAALRATGECVIAIPPAGLAETVVGVGNCSGRSVDKFARFDLTRHPASRVGAPLIGECFANLECRVVDTSLVETFNLFVLEVVAAWRTPVWPAGTPHPPTLHHRGHGTFAVDGDLLTLPSRMP